MSDTVYAYSGTNGKTVMVDDGDINYTGTWSSSGTYYAATKDTVLYGSAKFITIIDNVGGNPLTPARRNQSAKWASLVVIRQGTSAEPTAEEAYDEAVRAYNLANGAYEIAVAGTNYADLLATWSGTHVSTSGGTLTGNLRAPQVFLGVGTLPTSSAVNGTLFYDFLTAAYHETTVDTDIVVSAKNITPGAEMSAVLISDGTPREITYDGQFSWFGTQVPRTSAVADKKVIVAMASTGTIASKVLAASTPQL